MNGRLAVAHTVFTRPGSVAELAGPARVRITARNWHHLVISYQLPQSGHDVSRVTSIFKTGSDFAAWIGIVSCEDSTGGKQQDANGCRCRARQQDGTHRLGCADQEKKLSRSLDGRDASVGVRSLRLKNRKRLGNEEMSNKAM